MPDDPATPPASASPEHPGDAAARTFTGRQRRRQTRRSVIIADYVAAAIITAGGIGVVLAFGVIVVYLVWVAMPLLWPASVAHTYTTDLPALAERPEESSDAAEAMPVATAIDDNRVAFWMLDEQGQLSLYRAAAAELVEVRQLSDRPVTAISSDRDLVAIGRDDGTIQFGQISFRTQFLREVPDNLDLATSRPGDTIIHDGGVAELLDDGQVRLTRVHVEISDPAAAGGVEEPSPILRIDYVVSANVEAVVALREDGQLLYDLIRKRRDMRTGRVAAELISNELPLGRRAGEDLPRATFMGRNGTMVYVLYPDGHLTRYNTRDAANARIVEEIDLLPAGADVSAAEMLLGDITLIVADQKGGISGWFPAPYPEGYDGPTNPDGLRMVRAHEFEGDGNPITAIGLSGRDRQFLTGDSAGNVALRHMTSATTQGRAAVADGVSIRLLAMAPQANAMLVVDERRRVSFFAIDNPHPEGKLVALFKPIHYEGRTGPEHFWQSTAGTDDVEPKLGLAPLIFGTLKATVYALCFAIPIAILAAIYSSEFMNGHVRTVVKPTVELMAGLPSVVLGFIAALVFAPFVENVVPAVLLLFVSIPLGVMLFGFIWQLVPPQSTQQFGPPLVAGLYLLLGLGLLWGLGPSAGWLATYGAIAALLAVAWLAARDWAGVVAPFVLMLQVVALMVLMSFMLLGPAVEGLLIKFYGGDFRAWLDGRVGTGPLGAVPGWLMLFVPGVAVAVVVAFNVLVKPRVPLLRGEGLGRVQLGLLDLGRFAVLGIVSLTLALALAMAVSVVPAWLGLGAPDVRGGLLGTFIQRNAFNVGIFMGFAIIPLIYTVSEDALNSVPDSLRSAALGAGATPWQTAIRVVLPVAMSGIFSACMIGMGRAAGETMIVLMAAGNTPVMDWNLFSGLRTLSANIAVELPEAPVNSTHYRVLFLSALVLFAITFVVNTAAEIVRLRFRKRAFQL